MKQPGIAVDALGLAAGGGLLSRCLLLKSAVSGTGVVALDDPHDPEIRKLLRTIS